MRNAGFRFSCASARHIIRWLPLAILLFVLPHAAFAQTVPGGGYVTAVSDPVPLSPILAPAGVQTPNTLTDLLSRCAAVAAARGGPVPVLVDSSGKIFCGAVSASAIVAPPPAMAALPVAMPTGPCTASSGAKGAYDLNGACVLPLCPPLLTVKCEEGHHIIPGNGMGADGCPLPAQCVANSGPCTTSGGAKGIFNGLGICAPDICPSFALECGPNQHAEVNGGTSDDGCPIPPQCVKNASR